MHHFVGADSSCISWGHAQNGELGYGPNGQKYVYTTFLGNLVICFFLILLFSNPVCTCPLGLQLYPKRWIYLRVCM